MSNDDVFVFRFFGCRLGKARKVGRHGRYPRTSVPACAPAARPRPPHSSRMPHGKGFPRHVWLTIEKVCSELKILRN